MRKQAASEVDVVDHTDYAAEARRFVALLASQLKAPEGPTEPSRRSLEVHFEGVVQSLPKGPLRQELKRHLTQYVEPLWAAYVLQQIAFFRLTS